MNIGNILLALVVFSVIIIFHEFGHFIVAKYNKVGVIEFSLGMGPRIVSWGKSSDGKYHLMFFKSNKFFEEHPEFDENTIYSWKILPLGGSCMMLGEEEAVEDDKAFGKKSVLARMAIIFAGPFFNFILALVFAIILVSCYGYESPEVRTVDEGSAAQEAGMQVGDVITSMNQSSIVLNGEVSYYTLFHPLDGSEIEIGVKRDGVEQTLKVTPKKNKDGVYKIGFLHGKVEKVGFVDTIGYSFYEVKYYITTTLQSLWWMITGHASLKDISGPVGIVSYVGEVVEEAAPSGIAVVLHSLLVISLLLTANLGVMNLIPIPALDGGRLLFLFFELILRKPLPQKAEQYVNTAGFVLLMLLMVFIFANDIIKLF